MSYKTQHTKSEYKENRGGDVDELFEKIINEDPKEQLHLMRLRDEEIRKIGLKRLTRKSFLTQERKEELGNELGVGIDFRQAIMKILEEDYACLSTVEIMHLGGFPRLCKWIITGEITKLSNNGLVERYHSGGCGYSQDYSPGNCYCVTEYQSTTYFRKFVERLNW